MFFRAVGSTIFLFLTAVGSPRSAPYEWIIAFSGDFVIGSTSLFLAYQILKKPTVMLWGILLAWNAVGVFDLIGALSLTITTPFSPFPEIGLNEIGVRTILILNTILQTISLVLMFQSSVLSYFNFKNN